MATYIPARALDGNGVSIIAKLNIYEAGTTTRATAYSDIGMTTAHVEPIDSDATGAWPAIYLPAGDYKLDMTDADGVSLPGYPIDDVPVLSTRDYAADLVTLLDSTDALQAGRYIETTKEGYVYLVVATGGDIVTDGGTQLQIVLEAENGIRPEQFGGTGRDEMVLARDYALANSVPLILASRDYDIGTATAFDFQGVNIRVGSGASVTGFVLIYGALPPTVTAELVVNYDDGTTTFNHSFTPSYSRPWAEKSLWLGEGDIDRTKYEVIDASAMNHATCEFPLGDEWTDSVAPTGDATQVTWPVDLAAEWRISFAPVRGGHELNCVFGAGEYQRCALIRTSLGYFAFYAQTSTAQGLYCVKLTGATVATTLVDWIGRFDHASMQPGNSMWTIRIIDHRTWEVLLNGMSVTGKQDIGDGLIYDAGFGSYGDATVDVTVEQVTRTTRASAWGPAPTSLLIVGDSISAPIQGDWPTQLREMMDATYGMKVLAVTNVAYAGANSADMVATITEGGTHSSNYALVLIGTNDIQGGSPAETTLANLGAIDSDGGLLSLLRQSYCEPIVAIPPLWYNQTLSGGSGGEALNYEKGARTRAAIMRLCAARNIKCVDLQQALGPVLSNYLTAPEIDPIVRDNLHLTQAGNRALAVIFGRALADEIFRDMTPKVQARVLPDLWENSWASSSVVLTVGDDGRVHLNGLATAGTKTDGTTIYTLPTNLRPITNLSFTTVTDVTAETARVDVQADGAIKIYQISTATAVALDGVSWQAV